MARGYVLRPRPDGSAEVLPVNDQGLPVLDAPELLVCRDGIVDAVEGQGRYRIWREGGRLQVELGEVRLELVRGQLRPWTPTPKRRR